MNYIITVIVSVLLTASTAMGKTADRNHVIGDQTKTVKKEVTERFEQTYQLNSNGSVKIANVIGDIRVTTWDNPQVRLIAVKSASSEERLKDLTLKIDSTADMFSVKSKYKEYDDDENWKSRGNLSVSYEITVPRTANMKSIASVTGDVFIDGTSNGTNASSVSGNVEARNLGGETKVSSVSGNVTVDINNIESGSTVRVNSVSGNVNLKIPSYVGANVSATTVSGDISNDFGLEVDRGKFVGSSMNGTFGDGSITIKLSTVSGRIELKS
ncbi:MAG: DUF4097 family beta strand repeat-containing protein [Pyrinomonadaceae bacterium]